MAINTNIIDLAKMECRSESERLVGIQSKVLNFSATQCDLKIQELWSSNSFCLHYREPAQ